MANSASDPTPMDTADAQSRVSRRARTWSSILEARQRLVSALPKIEELPRTQDLPPSDDPYDFERSGFYNGPIFIAGGSESHKSDLRSSKRLRKLKKRSSSASRDGARDATTGDRSKKRLRVVEQPADAPLRRKANWNDDQDRVLRRCIRKWGWGCWKRIERSGKLPAEYTAKMISNRARTLDVQSHKGSRADEPVARDESEPTGLS